MILGRSGRFPYRMKSMFIKEVSSISMDKIILWTLSIIPCIVLGIFVYNYAINIPFWDDYDVVLRYLIDLYNASNFNELLEVLFQSHNEHRIVVQRIIVFLDHFFYGEVSFERFLFYAYIVMITLLAILHASYKNLFLLAIASLALCIPRVDLNFWTTSGLQNVGVLVFAFGAFKYIDLNTSYKNIFIASVMALFSILTSASGVLTFIIGFFFMVVKNKHFKQSLTIYWGLISVAVISWFLLNYSSPKGHPGIMLHTIQELGQLGAHSFLLSTSFFRVVLRTIWAQYIAGFAFHVVWIYMLYKYKNIIIRYPLELSMFVFMLLNSWMISISRHGLVLCKPTARDTKLFQPYCLSLFLDFCLE